MFIDIWNPTSSVMTRVKKDIKTLKSNIESLSAESSVNSISDTYVITDESVTTLAGVIEYFNTLGTIPTKGDIIIVNNESDIAGNYIVTEDELETEDGLVKLVVGTTSVTSITIGDNTYSVSSDNEGAITIDIDDEVTEDSTNLVSSGAVYTYGQNILTQSLAADASLDGYALLDSPDFTGTPTIDGVKIATVKDVSINGVKVYTETNPELEPDTDSVCSWQVTHSLDVESYTVCVTEVSSGIVVYPAITKLSENILLIEIKSSDTISEGTYKVEIVGGNNS